MEEKKVGDEKKLTVRAAERALDILLCFAHQSQLSLTEIAKQTHLNKSTVFRLLATLERKGFLKRDVRTDKYQLGFSIWELAANLDHSNDPAILLLPEMERLRDELDETVSLYILDGCERVRVQAVESQQAIRRVAPIGARLPLAMGASGKVLLAYSQSKLIEKVLNDPSWPAEVDREEFLKQLAQTVQNGYAISMEEREAGTAAVSVPVFNRQRELVAALAVSGPISRMSLDKMMQFVPSLLHVAEQMGTKLG